MLKYQFIAEFTDGTTFVQNPEDVSSLDHERSSFYDLLQETKQIRRFTLVGEGHDYAVDLIDGHFEVDNVSFWALPKDLPAIPDSFKLVYFRRHTHDFSVTGEEKNHSIRFVIGWECNIGGKNYNQTIGVD